MQDIEELKKDADALGVKYRSDIKYDALQAKIDKHNKVEPVKAVEVDTKFKIYKNTGIINVFTEDGRCRPGKTVHLTEKEAAQYKALECQD